MCAGAPPYPIFGAMAPGCLIAVLLAGSATGWPAVAGASISKHGPADGRSVCVSAGCLPRASDSALLQLVVGHSRSAEAAGLDTAGPAVDGADGCFGMPDVKRECSNNGCKVLAGGMTGFTCTDFCRRSGRLCTAAWEDSADTCDAKASLSCGQDYQGTSDLLCECSPPLTGLWPGLDDAPPSVVSRPGACTGLQDVERSCSVDGCKVLAGGMRGVSCNEYCERAGYACQGAWEEVDETCNVQETRQCDRTYTDTSDLLCECAPAGTGGGQDLGVAVGGKGCDRLENVERSCSPDGCRVLADGMRGLSCQDYCGRGGYTCRGAWEEVDETCGIRHERQCGQVYTDTSDMLCECGHVEEGGAASGSAPHSPSEWELVWAEEFDGRAVDAGKWKMVQGGGGFGNQELQHYTDREENARVSGGHLTLTARCERHGREHFTSAKLTTKHRGQWGPGHRVEVRAKMPTGRGTWPAIWMLPVSSEYGRWPASGEIDIVEAVGCTQNKVFGTVHTGDYNHMKNTQAFNKAVLAVNEWHTYAVDWREDGIEWYVDDKLYGAFAPSDQASPKWPFDEEFYLVINLAVGGSWGGSCIKDRMPSCSSHDEFGTPQVMEVDYARVYKRLR